MNCPNCQKELPENFSGTCCPHCSRDLSANSTAPLPVNLSLPPISINWWVFFAILLALAVLALLGSLLKSDALSVTSPVLGGPVAGVVCGVLLARRMGRTSQARVGFGCWFVALLGFPRFALGCAGCMVGGFKMNLH